MARYDGLEQTKFQAMARRLELEPEDLEYMTFADVEAEFIAAFHVELVENESGDELVEVSTGVYTRVPVWYSYPTNDERDSS